MADHEQYEALLYQYEVLRARLKVREHYLKTVVREVYENIGQVLSLIRVQLSSLNFDIETAGKEKIDTSGELVGQTIRDLRTICQLFYPEQDIITSAGFNRVLVQEINAQYPGAYCNVVEGNSAAANFNGEKGLILFGILLEIFILIKEKQKGNINSAEVKYTNSQLTVGIDYSGEIIRRGKIKNRPGLIELSIFERATLLGGDLKIKNTGDGNRRIKLVVPIN